MTRSFKPAEVFLLFAFAAGLAAIDAFGRSGSSGCPQCELNLMERAAQGENAVAPSSAADEVIDAPKKTSD